MKEFEYLFTTRDAALFDAADVAAWKAKYGTTRYNATADDALKASCWLKDNYPDTRYAVVNHPSRNKGSYTIDDFRHFKSPATNASKNQYYRMRGANLGADVAGLTQDGEPLADQRTGTTDNTARFNDINDRNYRSLWFYSNPVFVSLR